MDSHSKKLVLLASAELPCDQGMHTQSSPVHSQSKRDETKMGKKHGLLILRVGLGGTMVRVFSGNS